MQDSLKRLSRVALFCFFPLAIIGMQKQKSSPRKAIKFYYLSILIFIIFLCFLSFYTYSKGGTFIKAIGTFY